MPASPASADPGWDEDLAWLDRDPERECWLDRAREHDEPPEPEEYEDCAPLTPDELAEIEDAAADDLPPDNVSSPGYPIGGPAPGHASRLPANPRGMRRVQGEQPSNYRDREGRWKATWTHRRDVNGETCQEPR